MLRWFNGLFGLFGYEWVLDTTPYEPQASSPTTDEGWDDLYQHNPRYVLRKKVS